MPIAEVALSSSETDETVFLWDIKTNAVLATYKQSGGTSKHGLSLLGKSYFVCSQKTKNNIRHYTWLNDTPREKSTTVENCSVIVGTKDGSLFLGGSTSGKIYVWETSTGNLLNVLTAHYSKISCLKFSDDRSFLISCGEDGIVSVWNLSRLISQENAKAIHTFSGHALPITDIYVGYGLEQARITTVSLDRSCKMWELTTESLLFSLIYPCALCAVVLDPAESLLFVGGTDGKIFQSILYSDLFVTRTRSYESGLPTEDKIEELVYHGHSQAVTCLSLSLDASLLVSASEDGTLIVWDVQCRQQLRTFNKHGGPVTNLLLLTKPTTLFTEKFDYCVPPISPLNRYKSAMAASVPVVIPPFRSSFYVDDGANKGLLPAIRPSFLDDSDETKRNLQEKILSLSAKTDSLETELARVKSLNSELFARLLRSGGCPI